MSLVLFCIGTVQAASMGIGVAPVQDAPATHCHDMGGGDSHDHVKPHAVADCHCCPACLPGLAAAITPVIPLTASIVAVAPQAHYLSPIGILPLRPPIST
ncbi:MAG TPA: hypothetical protein PKW44_01480 [Methylophilaceae bacterium]|nr:hypothetical protein [Methylophilaceae bacterium]HQR60514.1 hypothetical protein [Methylophilaceae bacterium]